MLHQPGRRNFHALRSAKVRHLQTLSHSQFGQALILLRRNNWVLKERSRAAAVFIALHNKHGFLLADAAHRLAHLGQRWALTPTSEIAAQVSIFQLGLAVVL